MTRTEERMVRLLRLAWRLEASPTGYRAADLADWLDVPRRTLYRDLAVLAAAFPITSYRGRWVWMGIRRRAA